MSSRKQLPPQPDLRNLKNQAKSLLKSLQAGDPDALGRLQASLPRLSATSQTDTHQADIVLQEVQHVIAREHGFRNWTVLQAVVEIDFDVLAKLDRPSAQTLLSEVSLKDCIIALKTAREEVKEKLLASMSPGHRNLVESEVGFLENPSGSKYARINGKIRPEEIREAQRRILQQLAQSAEAGDLVWPADGKTAQEEKKAPSAAVKFCPSPRLADLARRPLEQLSTDEIAEMWKGIAEQVKPGSTLSLESFFEEVASPLIREGLQLAVDGTEPDLTKDVLETRTDFALVPQQRSRLGMIIDGLVAIMQGDNPRVVRHKLDVFFNAQPSFEKGTVIGPKEIAAAELLAQLRQRPLQQMSLSQVADFFVDMSYLSRSDGVEALKPLQEALRDVCDPSSKLLYCGLELALDKVPYQQVVGTLSAQMGTQLECFEKACKMVVAGATELQPGVEPEMMEEAVRQAAV